MPTVKEKPSKLKPDEKKVKKPKPQPSAEGPVEDAEIAPSPNGQAPARDILYPARKAILAIGKNSVTVEKAEKILGWEAETPESPFGADFLFIDEDGKKVRCHNNTQNRPFTRSLAMTLAYEHLNRNFKDNGEALIIGETGQCLSCQHRLVGLKFAEQIRLRDPDKWKHRWDGPVVMETTISVGVSEAPEVVRTIDNVRTRSLSDVLFTDPETFGGFKSAERKTLAKALEHAVTFLWDRTGAYRNFFITKRTHSIAISFIERHKTLLDIVVETYRLYEDDLQTKAKRIGLGVACALHYLMACCDSDGAEYRSQSPRHEGDLDWSNREKALAFWAGLCDTDDKKFEPVRKALALLLNSNTAASGRTLERVGTVIKAWDLFRAGKNFTPAKLNLNYDTDQEPAELDDFPDLGGIDMGEEPEPDVEEAEVETDPVDSVEEEGEDE